MTRCLTRDEVRAVDVRAIEHYGMHSLVLMENAGRGTVDVLEQLGIAGPIVLLCGRGNNGGDGFVIARHLLLRGYEARVVVFDPPTAMSADARANYGILVRSQAPIVDLSSGEIDQRLAGELRAADWIVDALLGTGARGTPRGAYAVAIDLANRSSARRLAVDWPSGLDCDTGAAESPTFRATATCTFVALKQGSQNPDASAYLGQVHVVDIGVPRQVIDDVRAGKK